MDNLPFPLYVLIEEGISRANHLSIRHDKFINPTVRGSILLQLHRALHDASLGMALQEYCKVVLNGFVRGAGRIGQRGQQSGMGSVELGDRVRIAGLQCLVPHVKETANGLFGGKVVVNCRRIAVWQGLQCRDGGNLLAQLLIGTQLMYQRPAGYQEEHQI